MKFQVVINFVEFFYDLFTSKTDINECAPGGGSECDPNADCENFGGGYACHCKPGFKEEKVGDPVTGQCVRKYLKFIGRSNQCKHDIKSIGTQSSRCGTCERS